ncbi:MAG: type IV secretory system conjugative DNA transfer family protein [Hyphomicrobiaceae bacterium]
MISPPTDLSPFTPTTLMALVDAILDDPAARIRQPTIEILNQIGDRPLHDLISRHVKGYLSRSDAVVEQLPALGTVNWGKVAATIYTRLSSDIRRNARFRLAYSLSIEYPAAMLTEKDRAAIRGMAQLVAHAKITPHEWALFLARMAWHDGKGHLVAGPAAKSAAILAETVTILKNILPTVLPAHEVVLGDAVARISRHALAPVQQALPPPGFKRGIRFLKGADIDGTPYLATKASKASLYLGRMPRTREHIYYAGHESLITIGGPGSGKSMAHVIPNLLLYPGSALVLDVKGELWDMTAGYRAKHFGPVFRFSPTDTGGRTHRYNPFDFISADMQEAANDCEVFSYQVIVPNPETREPFWDNRARDFLWAFAMIIAASPNPKNRIMEALSDLTAIPTEFKDLTKRPYIGSKTQKVIQTLHLMAKQFDIPDLGHAATSIESSLVESERLTSIFDNVRRALALFGRSKRLRNAMATSDWRPEQLRNQPGSTIYLCIPDSELKAYAPIIRVMFSQHRRILSRHRADPKEAPITFFLDEMPQLGTFDDILTMQDLGRGAGLRLWMFAQYMSQIRNAYGQDRTTGIIEANRIRCYMQPDMDAATHLERALGDTVNELTGERRPLATVPELQSSPDYTNKIILSVRGHLPAVLDKVMAFEKLKDRMISPPDVPVAG